MTDAPTRHRYACSRCGGAWGSYAPPDPDAARVQRGAVTFVSSLCLGCAPETIRSGIQLADDAEVRIWLGLRERAFESGVRDHAEADRYADTVLLFAREQANRLPA